MNIIFWLDHFFCTDPFMFMKNSDEAANTTLCELFGDICIHSSFDPMRTASQLKNEGSLSNVAYHRFSTHNFSDVCKRMNTLNSLRRNGECNVLQIFIAILESDPVNSIIVQKIKGNNASYLFQEPIVQHVRSSHSVIKGQGHHDIAKPALE